MSLKARTVPSSRVRSVSMCSVIFATRVVQLLAERLDLLGVAREPLLPPALRHHLQQRDQRQRAGGKHAARTPKSISCGSCCSADWKNASPGRNITTNSGDGCTCSQ